MSFAKKLADLSEAITSQEEFVAALTVLSHYDPALFASLGGAYNETYSNAREKDGCIGDCAAEHAGDEIRHLCAYFVAMDEHEATHGREYDFEPNEAVVEHIETRINKLVVDALTEEGF